MTVVKKVIVRSCTECPHQGYERTTNKKIIKVVCRKAVKVISQTDVSKTPVFGYEIPIPEWCPLPDDAGGKKQ